MVQLTDALTLICYECVSDDFLKAEIQADDNCGTCDYCGNHQASISIDDLAQKLDGILTEHFYLTPDHPTTFEYAVSGDDWSRDGWPLENVIAEIVGASKKIAADLRETLSNEFSRVDPSDGEPDPYGSDAMYAEVGSDGSAYREKWDSFCSSILTDSRYFSRYAEECLGEIFDRVGTLKNYQQQSAITVVGPDAENMSLFRARVANTEIEIRDILIRPVKELGPPPSEKARAGRMNPAGISVFYGAMDLQTCVAEIRPPVGSFIVAARFEVIRPLRLLDFEVMESVYEGGSYFDPSLGDRQDLAAFLRALGKQIAKPVLPHDETFGYLPTQAVAEYLSEKVDPPLDGIIYHSTQTGSTGRNIVLFRHASKVETDDQDNVQIEIDFGTTDEDDPDDRITIVEIHKSDKTVSHTVEATVDKSDMLPLAELLPSRWEPLKAVEIDIRIPALRLLQDAIEVLTISAVEYSKEPRTVTRIRMASEEDSCGPVDY